MRWDSCSPNGVVCAVRHSCGRVGAKSSGEPRALQRRSPRKAAATKARAGLQCGATLRARADVDADDRFTLVLHGVEAVLAE
jgi:hypothetical protein